MNAAGYNEFTGSVPTEIGLITGLKYLDLSEWKYIVDRLDC